jgi:cytochrome c biogenesis protein CcmG, thiol:disulfide interchange protein DsbE
MDPGAPSPKLNWRVPPLVMIAALLGFLAVVGVAAWILPGALSATSDTPRVGDPAPPIALQDLDGKRVTLADHRGHPVIVNFWAEWCVPCRSEMPAINAAAQANPNVVVLAVDVGDGPARVQKFVEEVPLGFSPLLDPAWQVTNRYKVSSLPSSFFIGPDGTIRAINVGPMDQSAIEANLRRAT